MEIHVQTTARAEDKYINATGYHVDDDGRLHITHTGKGNVATYHAHAWASVERVEDGK